MIRLLTLLALALPCAASPQIRVTGSSAGVRDPIAGVPENRPPVIECDFDPSALGQRTVEFQVTATDPEGDRVSLRLAHQPDSPRTGASPLPYGAHFVPLLDQASPATGTVHWWPEAGPRTLVFVAHDDRNPELCTRHEIRVVVPEMSGIRVADVNGDGQDDVVLSAPGARVPGELDAGVVYVWFGSATPAGAPDLTLHVPGAASGDFMEVATTRVPFADLTGDGQIDIIAHAPVADIDGVSDAGAIYVWAGGPDLADATGPTATLTVPGAGAAQLGYGGLFVREVTGDGIPDLIAATPFMDVAGVARAGGILVFAGGPTLAGRVTPHATLVADRPSGGFGQNYFNPLAFRGVTGDGVAEIVYHHAADTTPGGFGEGATLVWETGAALVGTPSPHAVLVPPDTGPHDAKNHWRIADISGDGVADVLLADWMASAGQLRTGQLYVWTGGPALTGVLPPMASLENPTAMPNDQLGRNGMHAVDVTDDGILDIVTASSAIDGGAETDTGAILIFPGRPAWTGTIHPSATLTLPDAATLDSLAINGLHFADLDGDSTLDILTTSSREGDEGPFHFWSGGPSILSSPSPTTWGVPGIDNPVGVLGPVAFDDLDGDGLLDIVLDESWHANRTGATVVWYGREPLGSAPDAICIGPGTTSWDAAERELSLVDVTGDGRPDIVQAQPLEDVGGIEDAGAIHVWEGTALAGTVAPTASLWAPGALPDDGHSRRVAFADLTGEGVLDIVAIAREADSAGLVDTGGIHVWRGGRTLVGAPSPLATLTPPASSLDQVGTSWRLVDWDGDGVDDLFAGSPHVRLSGFVDVGALYFWSGARLGGTTPPDVSLQVPGNNSNDWLTLAYTFAEF